MEYTGNRAENIGELPMKKEIIIWYMVCVAAILFCWMVASCKSSPKSNLKTVGRITAESHHGELETALQHAERMTGMKLQGNAIVYLEEGTALTHLGWKGVAVSDYKGRGAGIIGGVQQFNGRALIYLTDGRVWLNDPRTSNAVHEMAHLIYSSHGIRGEDNHHDMMGKRGFKW